MKTNPTHSPTETVSEYCVRCGKDKGVDPGACFVYGKSWKRHWYVKETTKVEPTVEKWKGKVAILFAKHLAVAMNPLTEDKDWLDNWESLREEMWGLLSHSVQEAKAEMIYKALDEIGNVNAANALSKGEAKWEFKNGLDCAKAILNHLLTSLKQEEDK